MLKSVVVSCIFMLLTVHMIKCTLLLEQPPILINEINTVSASVNKWSQFIELKYVDQCQFKKDSSETSGPSLDGYYLLVIKGYDTEHKRPLVEMFINMTGYRFQKNRTTFVIGDYIGLQDKVDIPFENIRSVIVKHDKSQTEYIPLGDDFPYIVVLLYSKDSPAVDEHLRTNLVLSEDSESFLQKVIIDAIPYARFSPYIGCRFFEKLARYQFTSQYYVHREFDMVMNVPNDFEWYLNHTRMPGPYQTFHFTKWTETIQRDFSIQRCLVKGSFQIPYDSRHQRLGLPTPNRPNQCLDEKVISKSYYRTISYSHKLDEIPQLLNPCEVMCEDPFKQRQTTDDCITEGLEERTYKWRNLDLQSALHKAKYFGIPKSESYMYLKETPNNCSTLSEILVSLSKLYDETTYQFFEKAYLSMNNKPAWNITVADLKAYILEAQPDMPAVSLRNASNQNYTKNDEQKHVWECLPEAGAGIVGGLGLGFVSGVVAVGEAGGTELGAVLSAEGTGALAEAATNTEILETGEIGAQTDTQTLDAETQIGDDGTKMNCGNDNNNGFDLPNDRDECECDNQEKQEINATEPASVKKEEETLQKAEDDETPGDAECFLKHAENLNHNRNPGECGPETEGLNSLAYLHRNSLNDDIYQIYDLASEADAILTRGDGEFLDDFNSQELQEKVRTTFVCQKHRKELGIDFEEHLERKKTQSVLRNKKGFKCLAPDFVPDGPTHDPRNIPFAKSRVTRAEAKVLLEKKNIFIQVGIEGGLSIPVIALVVEGGANTIQHVLESVKHEIPVLICDGTGRAADLLADVVSKYPAIEQAPDEASRSELLEELKQFVADTIKRFYPTRFSSHSGSAKSAPYLDLLVQHVIRICEREHRQFISVFRFEHRSDLDLAILACMMEKKKMNLNQQLHLALAWDRADCAAARLQEDPGILPRSEVYYLLTEALVNNQTEFCRVLLDYGWSAKRYLTVARLRELYNRTVNPYSHLWPLMGFQKKGKRKEGVSLPCEEINLTHVYTVVKYCSRRFQKKSYEEDHLLNDSEAAKITFAKPFLELFLWTVLICRVEMALLLWDYLVEEPLTMALIGTVLCDVLEEEIKDYGTGIKEKFLALKVLLEKRAIGLVNQAYCTNREKAILLIKRPSKTWGNLTSLAIAALASDKAFISTACCQDAIFKIWKGGFEAGALRITLCTFTFLPVLFLVKFDDEDSCCGTGRCPPGHCWCGQPALSYDMTDAGRGSAPPARPPYIQAVNLRSFSRGTATLAATAGYADGTGTTAPKTWPRFQRRTMFVGPSFSVELPASTHCADELQFVKRISLINKILTFYSAPVVKFTNHTLWYILYLILYSYVILFDYRPEKLSGTELLLYCWQLTLVIEEIRDLLTYPGENLRDKLEDYWYFSSFGTWNRIDVLSLLMSGLAFLLRWSYLTFPVARLMMVVTVVVYIVRMFKIYFVNSYLGPKVVMLKRMSWDLAMFLLVVVVFLISYSVASQALLKQNKQFGPGIFYDLFLRGIWQIFGELSDTDMEEFKKKPLLPPPFIVIEHVYLVLKWLRKCCQDKPKHVVIDGKKLGRRELEFLEIFEKVCRSDYIDNCRREESSHLENMIAKLQEDVSKMNEILTTGGLDDSGTTTSGGRRTLVTSESQQYLRSIHTSLENIRKVSGDIC